MSALRSGAARGVSLVSAMALTFTPLHASPPAPVTIKRDLGHRAI